MATRRTAAEGVLSKAEQLLHLPQMVWSGASIAKIPFFFGDLDGFWMDFGWILDGFWRQQIGKTSSKFGDLPKKLKEFIAKHVDFTSKHWMSPTKH